MLCQISFLMSLVTDEDSMAGQEVKSRTDSATSDGVEIADLGEMQGMETIGRGETLVGKSCLEPRSLDYEPVTGELFLLNPCRIYLYLFLQIMLPVCLLAYMYIIYIDNYLTVYLQGFNQFYFMKTTSMYL